MKMSSTSILPNSELDFDKNLVHIGGCAKVITQKSLHLHYIDLPSVFVRWVEQHACLPSLKDLNTFR